MNHFYYYCVDEDFRPFFLKLCSHFPYNAFSALDDLPCLQRICEGLGQEQIDALLRK